MNDARYDLLRQSVIDAPVVMKGDYAYFIHPLSDGVPQQSAELLAAARDLIHEQVNWDNVDIILGIEAMGIPLATALSLSSGKPLVCLESLLLTKLPVIRKEKYTLMISGKGTECYWLMM